MEQRRYGGFWIRSVAAIIDSILLMIVILPVVLAIYGKDYFSGGGFVQGFWDAMFSYILPAIVVILFWMYKSATPGKIITKLQIIDAKSGGKPTTKQFAIRYIGYYIASIPLFLGILWVGFDKRKQGWHDKIAGTVVVRK